MPTRLTKEKAREYCIRILKRMIEKNKGKKSPTARAESDVAKDVLGVFVKEVTPYMKNKESRGLDVAYVIRGILSEIHVSYLRGYKYHRAEGKITVEYQYYKAALDACQYLAEKLPDYES